MTSPAELGMSAVRAAYGLLLIAAPGALVAGVARAEPGPRERDVVRLLGARHVAQALASACAGRRALGPGAAVDAVHAASMVALAVTDARLRRAEMADALVAAALAGVGTVLLARY
jgi:hypothetical protein